MSAENLRRARIWNPSKETVRFAPAWVSYIVMVTWFVVIAAPLVWLVVTSLRRTESYRASTLGWPEWAFSNFAEAWRTANFSVAVPNSIVYTLSIVACVVVLASMAGYGLARYRFPGRAIMLGALVVALTIPFSSIMFGVYDVVDALGLLGTRLGVILPAVALALPFATFYMRAFFLGIPEAISEAARIDGAGEITVFVRVMLPLASPGIATLAVFSGVWSWAMYLEPLLLANSASLRPVALGLSFFTAEYGGSNQPLIAAAAVIIVLPLVILSILLQRRFVEGMTAGAVK
ncbi:carbohydrate ABC transporter permease [Microbacterium betulae]|uniref:Carbohydrate ABC transporter permease n=1 Tax=Microbacterium betulae TaxID=2981139 RepID=A0AA97FH27_9MICO|nr:carbohydrate ABC transporter permease [Microbacterium sp. AB]WOF22384.1 carbohydrate ABC transporter permease [Microbacterium sp. AB]